MSAILSIIMPVYNVEKYLSEAIDSILAQTLVDWELVLVDDCSSDASGRICDEYASRDNRIKVLHFSSNSGSSAARNAGLSLIDSEFYTFIDSDDTIDSNAYAEAVAKAKLTGADVVMFGNDRLMPDGTYKPDLGVYSCDETFDLREDIEAISLASFGVSKGGWPPFFEGSACFAIFHRKFNDRYKIRFTSDRMVNIEDYLYKFEVLQCARLVCYLSRPFYHYRYNAESLSRKPDLGFLTKVEHAAIATETVLRKYGYQEASDYAMGFSIKAIRGCIKRVFMSGMPVLEQRKWLSSVIDGHPYIRNVYETYPWQKLPLRHRLGFKWLCEGIFWPYFILVVGQEFARKMLPGIFKS